VRGPRAGLAHERNGPAQHDGRLDADHLERAPPGRPLGSSARPPPARADFRRKRYHPPRPTRLRHPGASEPTAASWKTATTRSASSAQATLSCDSYTRRPRRCRRPPAPSKRQHNVSEPVTIHARSSQIGQVHPGVCHIFCLRAVRQSNSPGHRFLGDFLATRRREFGVLEPNLVCRPRSTEPKVSGSNPDGRAWNPRECWGRGRRRPAPRVALSDWLSRSKATTFSSRRGQRSFGVVGIELGGRTRGGVQEGM
jgi:hypothetical protein